MSPSSAAREQTDLIRFVLKAGIAAGHLSYVDLRKGGDPLAALDSLTERLERYEQALREIAAMTERQWQIGSARHVARAALEGKP